MGWERAHGEFPHPIFFLPSPPQFAPKWAKPKKKKRFDFLRILPQKNVLPLSPYFDALWCHLLIPSLDIELDSRNNPGFGEIEMEEISDLMQGDHDLAF